jgi:ABC-type multidrug transport system ATPase subunit
MLNAGSLVSWPKRSPNVIAMLDLGQYENCRAGTLSLGNKQRLSLAQAMVHHPIC